MKVTDDISKRTVSFLFCLLLVLGFKAAASNFTFCRFLFDCWAFFLFFFFGGVPLCELIENPSEGLTESLTD